MDLQIARWGNSLAMRIPADMAKRFSLREGDCVSARFTVDGALSIRPAAWNRKTFAAELSAARDTLPMGSSVMDELRQGSRY